MTEPTSTALREILATERFLTARMDAMDKALGLARDDLTRVPTELDRRIEGLKELSSHQNDTIAEKISQHYVLLGAVEKSLNEKYTELAGRITRIESSGEGRGQISGPLWGVAAAVLTAVIAAGIIAMADKKQQDFFPIIERMQLNQTPEVFKQRLNEIGK